MMTPTWLLLLVLTSPPSPIVNSVPDKPIEPTHGAPFDMKDIGSQDTTLPHGGISLTMKPVTEGVNKMIGVETDTYVNQQTAVQVHFPTKDGCEAAVKATGGLGRAVCLEIR